MSENLLSQLAGAAKSGVTAVAGGLPGAVVDAGLNALSMGSSAHYARKNARHNDELQRKLMADAPAIQRKALQDAGISIASMSGNFTNAPAAASGTAAGTPGGSVNAGYLAALNGANLRAQNRLIDAQAREVELRNSEVEDKQAVNRNATQRNIISFNGHDYTPDEFADFVKKNPDVDTSSAEATAIAGHVSDAAVDIDARKAEAAARVTHAQLEDFVSRQQLVDPDTRSALIKMPDAQYRQLQQAIKVAVADASVKEAAARLSNADLSLRDKQAALLELEYQVKKFTFQQEKDTNINAILSQIYKDGITFDGFVKLIVSAIVKSFNGGFSVGKFW